MGSNLPPYAMRPGSTTEELAKRECKCNEISSHTVASDSCLYMLHRAMVVHRMQRIQRAKCTMQASVLHRARWFTLLQHLCVRCHMANRVHHRLRKRHRAQCVVLWSSGMRLVGNFGSTSSSTSSSHGPREEPQLHAVHYHCRVVGKPAGVMRPRGGGGGGDTLSFESTSKLPGGT